MRRGGNNWGFSSNIIMISFCLLASCMTIKADDQFASSMKERDQKLIGNVLITGTAILMPVNRFVLLRRGDHNCAIRFTSYHVDGDFKTPEWHQYSEYEWYASEKKVGRLAGQGVRSGFGKLDRGLTKQFWRFLSTPGDTIIHCGAFSIDWIWPTGVSLVKGYSYNGTGIEVAPTRWEKVEEIDFSESSLIWYEFKGVNDFPKKQEIPIENLPPVGR